MGAFIVLCLTLGTLWVLVMGLALAVGKAWETYKRRREP